MFLSKITWSDFSRPILTSLVLATIAFALGAWRSGRRLRGPQPDPESSLSAPELDEVVSQAELERFLGQLRRYRWILALLSTALLGVTWFTLAPGFEVTGSGVVIRMNEWIRLPFLLIFALPLMYGLANWWSKTQIAEKGIYAEVYRRHVKRADDAHLKMRSQHSHELQIALALADTSFFKRHESKIIAVLILGYIAFAAFLYYLMFIPYLRFSSSGLEIHHPYGGKNHQFYRVTEIERIDRQIILQDGHENRVYTMTLVGGREENLSQFAIDSQITRALEQAGYPRLLPVFWEGQRRE